VKGCLSRQSLSSSNPNSMAVMPTRAETLIYSRKLVLKYNIKANLGQVARNLCTSPMHANITNPLRVFCSVALKPWPLARPDPDNSNVSQLVHHQLAGR
jgi:hypothetical protein